MASGCRIKSGMTVLGLFTRPSYLGKKKSSDMLCGFEKIIEERILTAQKRGEFENLPGAGKPLKFEDDRFVSEELRLAYKILKNADCVPVEIELKKEIKQTEDLLAGMQETSEKYRTLKKLNFLILKLNSIRDTSIVHEMPQVYTGKLVERFENSKTS
ncbi:MAG: DnaJ family domain-containing protein [Thermodesulfobacteriota bacterium]|nr:DnaJ family domain-containing protein [Thermodesulfobacteriota bacterium]